MTNKKENIVSCISENLKKIIINVPDEVFESLEEIRIRASKPLLIKTPGGERALTSKGQMTIDHNLAFYPSIRDIMDTLEIMSGYSLYAFDEELKNGFITLKGGHRVGITGKAVIQSGEVSTLRNLSGLNIRLCHEMKGCADKMVKHIIIKGTLPHTLIVSPPGCGKTTLLRDLVRQLSYGINGLIQGQNISVIDERSEIAGSYMGIAQNDLGPRTDILDCCPKAKGILMLIRAMSPDVIALDEIGGEEDIYMLFQALNCGIKIICTVHGESVQDLKNKHLLSQLLDRKIFERIIILSHEKGPGTILNIYDSDLRVII